MSDKSLSFEKFETEKIWYCGLMGLGGTMYISKKVAKTYNEAKKIAVEVWSQVFDITEKDIFGGETSLIVGRKR